MTFQEMIRAFRDWVVTATGLPDAKVRMGDSVDTRPAKPFATVFALETAALGSPESSLPGVSGTTTVSGHRTTTVRLSVFGPASYDYAEKARLAVYRSDLIQQALSAEIAIQGTSGNIQNVSAPRQTDFENRSMVDFFVGWVASVTDNVGGGTIETIDSTTDVGGIVSDIDV
tara:strand:+ start:100 stop:615 length:516 start_codon:yes stop_codon:yes gene_type:complete